MALYNVRAPSLPIPTSDYDKGQQDQFQYALRLYFNRLDAFNIAANTPPSGPTTDRPIENLQVGDFYYDTTLGIPIWYNGTVWKNASGTTV